MYVLLPSQNGPEKGDGSPAYVLYRKLGYMCRIYNAELNGSIENDSYQRTNDKIYYQYFNSQ